MRNCECSAYDHTMLLTRLLDDTEQNIPDSGCSACHMVHDERYFRPSARSRACLCTNSTLKSHTIENESVLSCASSCVIA